MSHKPKAWWSMPEYCGYVIEGPRDKRSRLVWWRRTCKRTATHGNRCWQHALPTISEDK